MAALSHALSKLSTLSHRGHRATWEACTEPPCPLIREALKYGGLPQTKRVEDTGGEQDPGWSEDEKWQKVAAYLEGDVQLTPRTRQQLATMVRAHARRRSAA